MKKKKIFVTGVAGFLGSHLAEALIEKGHHVVGCDSLMGGYLDNVHHKVEFYQYDCNFLNSMKKITKDVDIVYHCAAAAYEGLSVFSPYFINKNVYQNTVSVLSAAISNKVKRFVFTSSMARYGENKVPFTEDMKPNPQDPYGIGKYAAELQVKNLCEVHGVEYVIAVPHNIIGPRQKYDDPYRNVASIMINLMLQGKQPIIYGNGEQKRCFSFIQDCLQALIKLGFEDNVVGEVINIGPDEEFVSINELAYTIGKLLDFKVKPRYVDKRPQEVELANCSAEKARKLLGYRTEYSLEQGLSEMIDWIKKRGTKPFKYHIDLEIINELTPKTWKNKLF
ncbi:NAD-dependent epimerase/dehydratase family protein [Candidatus Woesearchaeota archaeon]|nr:NAD-dependent epimerase/dehydratase family protein [Candidatus Woesearchaeota archaeon]